MASKTNKVGSLRKSRERRISYSRDRIRIGLCKGFGLLSGGAGTSGFLFLCTGLCGAQYLLVGSR